MQALYFTPNGASVDMAIGALPSLPVPVNYPQYNSIAMLPLEGPQYSTQVRSLVGVTGESLDPSTMYNMRHYFLQKIQACQ